MLRRTVGPTPPAPSEDFVWADAPWGPVLRCLPLARAAADHCFTTRQLPLGERADDSGWRNAAAWLRLDRSAVVRPRQVHGATVMLVRRGNARPGRCQEADIVASDDEGRAVAVQAADCVPLLIADPVRGAVAAAHAGWRGTAAGVARVTIDALVSAFGSRPADLVAAIGPSIGRCCYQVGPELVLAFTRAGHRAADLSSWFVRDGDRYRLDLWQATRDQLRAAGVPAGQIFVAGLCTATHGAWFYSYRLEGAAAGRQAGLIRPPLRPLPD